MIYVDLPVIDPQLLPFYLAMEEFVAREKKWNDCFFMWQVDPTVIFGRNQLIENEVNLDYCKQHGIHTFRRKSGGGCVYADRSNIMFSYINSSDNVQFTFFRYVQMIATLLQKLGLNARASDRNDVLIGEKKVSGNAFYHLPGRNIVHGTMLYDTNMENMVGSITPTDRKLISKGVKSVSQHITLLKDHLSISLEEFKTFIRKNLCDKEEKLSLEDVERIREIEKEYLTPEFIYGNNPKYTVVVKKRLEGCGDFEARIELKNNTICSLNLMGDFFLYGDLDKGLLSRLQGVEYQKKKIEEALGDLPMDNYIMNLDKKKFLSVLFEK